MVSRLYKAIGDALGVENVHASDPGDVATAIVGLGYLIAKSSNIGSDPLSVLTSNIVAAEPDEEKAVAAVRRAYAANRPQADTVYS
jgi:hypothetical protein